MELTVLSIAVKIIGVVLYLCVAFTLQHSQHPLLHKVGRYMAAPFLGNHVGWTVKR